MTRRAGRASTAWLAGAAVILPLVATSVAGIPQATAGEVFSPPATPMILTRTLRRPLPDGKAVVSQRSYEVRFVPVPNGFRVDGQLIGAAVDAPPALAALAALEQARPDIGLLPILLDVHGRIVSADAPAPSEETRRAADMTSARIAGARLPTDEAAGAQAFVDRLRASPGRTPWPEDLFHPTAGERTDIRPLPGADASGVHASATIRTEARSSALGGLLDRFVRTVTTQLGEDRRVTEETWTLQPLTAPAK